MKNKIFVTLVTTFLTTSAYADRSNPTAKAEHVTMPSPPKLELPENGITHEAGVGSNQAYGRAGIVELGGSLQFNTTSDYTFFSARPSLGYFFMNNWEISAIMAWDEFKISNATGGDFSLLVEPSIHVPFKDYLFAFAGAGIGLSAAKGAGAGIAVAARAGLNVLIGRSGILSPEINLQYASNRSISTPQGTLLAVTTSFGFGAGYTIMW